jgi:YfiH family protein
MMFDIADLPQPNGAFEWVQAEAGPALRCRALTPYASHLFTTRHWPLGRDSESWAEVAAALKLSPTHLVRVRQVHGASVLVAGAREAANLTMADIIVATGRAGVGLAVQAADCVPLLMADTRTGAIAAAHAGWRGLAARVPAAAVSAMAREFGSVASDILAAVGPSVGACCYEVGADVAERFAGAGFNREARDRWFLGRPLASPTNPSMPGVPATARVNHWFFDGWSAVRDQLLDAGLQADRIFVAELCTASHPQTLCSYRRDGRQAGRIAGAITAASPHP